jgi:hypothetical protein
MKSTEFLFSSIHYAGHSSKGEKVLSLLSGYYYLGGKRTVIFDGKFVELKAGNSSWKVVALKISSYILWAPLTLPLFVINLCLRAKYFTGMTIKPQPISDSKQDSKQDSKPLFVAATILPQSSLKDLSSSLPASPIIYLPSPSSNVLSLSTDSPLPVISPVTPPNANDQGQKLLLSQPQPIQVGEEIEAKVKEEESIGYIEEPSPEQIEQSQLIQAWLDQHGHNYVAHAVWEGNIEKVIKRGAVIPAEAALKETGFVEYEKGDTQGSRGTLELDELTNKEKNFFTELSEKEESELKELQKNNQLTPAEQMELKGLYKEIAAKIDEDDDQQGMFQFRKSRLETKFIDAELKHFNKLVDVGLSKMDPARQSRYGELSAKALNIYERRRLKTLQRMREGFYVHFHNVGKEVRYARSIGVYLAARGHSEPEKIALSYYLKENNIYPRLTQKFKKWMARGTSKKAITETLLLAQEAHHLGHKLNTEIRTAPNSIRWEYGKCVVLRGNPNNIISEHVKGECILLRPWENEGEYFNLELAEKDTLLIGPKKDLEPYAEQLKQKNVKFAYLESFSKEQAEKFHYEKS